MLPFKRGNSLKAVGLLVALAGIVFAMTLGPTLGEPKMGPEIHLPSMENVPPSGTVNLHVE